MPVIAPKHRPSRELIVDVPTILLLRGTSEYIPWEVDFKGNNIASYTQLEYALVHIERLAFQYGPALWMDSWEENMPLAPLAERHPKLAARPCVIIDAQGNGGSGRMVFRGRYEHCITFLEANVRHIRNYDLFTMNEDGSLGRPLGYILFQGDGDALFSGPREVEVHIPNGP